MSERAVAAPDYKCQVCKTPMPLLDMPVPKFMDPTFVKVTCSHCNSYFMLSVKRVHGESKAVIQVKHCEPGELGRKLLMRRSAEIERERNQAEEAARELAARTKVEEFNPEKGLIDPEKEEVKEWEDKKKNG